MLLYHGTNAENLPAILQHGLVPRGRRADGDGNPAPSAFAHTVESHPMGIYLTDTYAMHFALNATPIDGFAAVIEVNADWLRSPALVPDEDVLEQIGRGNDSEFVPLGDMMHRTAFYRDHLTRYIGKPGDLWKTSLQAMGTCAYLDIIPPHCITRIATFSTKRNADFRLLFDPQVSILNYRLLSYTYRCQLAHLFGDPMPPAPDDPIQAMPSILPTRFRMEGVKIEKRIGGRETTYRSTPGEMPEVLRELQDHLK